MGFANERGLKDCRAKKLPIAQNPGRFASFAARTQWYRSKGPPSGCLSVTDLLEALLQQSSTTPKPNMRSEINKGDRVHLLRSVLDVAAMCTRA
jgi:hypothetical protein